MLRFIDSSFRNIIPACLCCIYIGCIIEPKLKVRFWTVVLCFSSETRPSEGGFRCMAFCLRMYSHTHTHMHGDWSSFHSVRQDLQVYVQVKGKIYVLWQHVYCICTKSKCVHKCGYLKFIP
jgi:hypothetical protein